MDKNGGNLQLKISYISPYDAQNIHSWSGLGYFISKALQAQGTELDFIGNLNAKAGSILRFKEWFYKKCGKDFAFEREISFVKQYAEQVDLLVKENSDLIFSLGTLPVAFSKSRKPKVFYTDCTFAGMLNFYPDFSNYSRETIMHGNLVEQTALDSVQLAIYTSDWAANSAIDNYKTDPGKIRVVPFGANVDHNYLLDDIKGMVKSRSAKECNLLFASVDWERKRGQFAIDVVAKLNELGLSARLHLIGINGISESNLPAFVVNHGFVSKSTEEGKDKINHLFMDSHFLLLPTKADASPLVLCEACSFGVPCITSDVGGIPSIIYSDVNGKTFSVDSSVEDYATYIQAVFTDRDRYEQLALSSFNEYKTRLNWQVAGKSIMKILEELK